MVTLMWNVHTGTPYYPGIGQTACCYIMRDAMTLVARLDATLDTRRTREGDRFTMTLLSPLQFQGATIEVVVSDVDRGSAGQG
jgi:hypothetical protein